MPAVNVASRLNGQFATLAIGANEAGAAAVPANAVVNLFDWEISIETRTVDATAFGDYWRQPVIVSNGWTARARAYFTAGQVTSYLSVWRLQSGSTGNAYKDPPIVTFTGYNDWTTLGSGKIVFQGDCFVTRGRISVPMAMVEQEIEFEGIGSPAVIG